LSVSGGDVRFLFRLLHLLRAVGGLFNLPVKVIRPVPVGYRGLAYRDRIIVHPLKD